MDEKKLTMDDVMPVWWFVTWRSILTAIGINIIILLIAQFTPLRDIVQNLFPFICLITTIFIQVLYFKLAINRNYKNFRLSAILTNNNQQNG